MAGTSRKTKATEDLPPESPSKRARNYSPSNTTTSSATASEEAEKGEDHPAHVDDQTSFEPQSDTPALDVPDYVSEDLLPRLHRLRTLREPRYNRYGIAYIPLEAVWGEGPNGRWSQYYYYLCHNDKPLVVWMVGVARWVQLKDNEKLSIGLQPLCDRDHTAAKDNSYGRCNPVQEPKTANTLVYANKWIKTNERDREHVFDEVYNAVDGQLRGWDASHKITADRIKYGDLVVVEFYIRRFMNKSVNSGGRLQAWGVTFDLLRIALLADGQVPVDEPPPDSAALI